MTKTEKLLADVVDMVHTRGAVYGPNHSDSVIDALAYISIYQTVLEAEADVNFTWGDD